MTLGLLLVGIAAAVASDDEPPPHNYLKGAESRRCDDSGGAGEIVVCGARRTQEGFRLRPLDARRGYEPAPVRAETAVGGGMLSLHGEAKDVGGTPSNRAMVTFATHF